MPAAEAPEGPPLGVRQVAQGVLAEWVAEQAEQMRAPMVVAKV